MSLKLGKRSFGEEDPSCLSVMHFHQLKRPIGLNFADMVRERNIEALRERFPEMPIETLSTVLDECENNLGLSIEVISRQMAPRPRTIKSEVSAPPGLAPRERQIRRIGLSAQPTVPKEPPPQVQNRDMQPEEVPIEDESELRNLSDFIIEKVVQSNTREEAAEHTFRVLRDFFEKVRTGETTRTRRLLEENKLLKKAFLKQFEKAQANTLKADELQRRAQSLEDETRRLRSINYELLLRLATLESPSEELRNLHIC